MPGVATAEPFVYGQLMLTTPEHFAGVLVRGIPPSAAANPDLATRLRAGSIEQLERQFAVPLQEGRGATVELPGIIVGGELARQLGVHVGDTVSVASAGGRARAACRASAASSWSASSTPACPTTTPASPTSSLADAQRLYEMGDGVTGVEVKVADLYPADAIARQIGATLGSGYRVRDWMEANHNLFSALTLQKTVYFIVLLLIILVAAFTVLATLIMVVMEKRKDIAILKSMGAPQRRHRAASSSSRAW